VILSSTAPRAASLIDILFSRSLTAPVCMSDFFRFGRGNVCPSSAKAFLQRRRLVVATHREAMLWVNKGALQRFSLVFGISQGVCTVRAYWCLKSRARAGLLSVLGCSGGALSRVREGPLCVQPQTGGWCE